MSYQFSLPEMDRDSVPAKIGVFLVTMYFLGMPVFLRGQRVVSYFLKYLDQEFEQLSSSLFSSCPVETSAESSSRTKCCPSSLQVL